MYNNPQQGGGPQGGRAPKKPVTNECKLEGIVRPRSSNDQDQIKFFPFPEGGGVIHISLEVQELSGTDPQTGQPRYVTTFVPVNIITNRIITQQLLQTICPGMRVRIVGSLRYKGFISKKTGQKMPGTLEVNAFVCEILSAPQQPVYPQQPAYGGYPQQGVAPMYGAPQQGGYPQQGGAPAYGGQPAYPPQQPAYPQQPPQGSYGPGYGAPQPAPQGYPGAPVQPAPQYAPKQGQQAPRPAQPAPPYYQPPAQPAAPDNDDMPPDDAPPVRPINV